MKIAVMTSQKRVEKYSCLASLPKDWELIFIPDGADDQEVLKRGGDADCLFVDAVFEVSRYLISHMPNLKLIHSEGVGYHRFDLPAAAERGIFVCNNRALNSGPVAEQAILLMLALQRRLCQGDQLVRDGKQAVAKGSFILEGIPELGCSHVGLLGFGSIGKETAKRLYGFGSKVSYFSRHRASPQEEAEYHASYLPLEELVSSCDILSLHLPATEETAHLVDKSLLDRMKPTALLINTARGEIVDQEALAQALQEGKIAGAGLDTLSPEPVTLDNPLLQLPPSLRYRVVFSPHVGGTTDPVFYKMHQTVWDNIRRVAAGERPINIVNGV